MRWALLLVAGCAYGQVGHINAGGSAYTDVLGQLWQADNSFVGGAVSTGSIPFGAPAYFATKRYGDFAYNLAVPDGNYTITLSFLENVALPTGGRVFNVSINGSAVLMSYDIIADVGSNVTTRKTFAATADRGKGIVVAFKTVTRSAIVNGIEIAAITSPASVPPTLELLEQCSGSGEVNPSANIPAWDASVTYPVNSLATYGSTVYASAQCSNVGHQPDISPTWWQHYAWSCDGIIRATITRADGTKLLLVGAPGNTSGSGTWTPIK